MRGIWLLCVVGLIHWNCNSSYRTLTKSNTDRWNTALEPQKHPLLIISSLFIIFFFFQISPSVSFAHSIPPYFPNCPPLWVTDTWGKMCVCCSVQAGCYCHQEQSHLLSNTPSPTTRWDRKKNISNTPTSQHTLVHEA